MVSLGIAGAAGALGGALEGAIAVVAASDATAAPSPSSTNTTVARGGLAAAFFVQRTLHGDHTKWP